LYGGSLPAGALGLDDRERVPVVGIPEAAAREALSALARGRRPALSLGLARHARNPGASTIAPFSSHGVAFDGTVKPDLTAPGVALMTSEPGASEDGEPRFGTVNGSSAAAAVVGGAAAVLAQARPALGARELEALLVGYARPLPDASVAAQGNGLLELGAAAAAEFGAEPAALTFGEATKAGWHETRTVELKNLTMRRLALGITAEQGGGAGLAISARPRRLLLRRGMTAVVRLTARLEGRPGTDATPAEGTVRIAAAGGTPLRIPWVIAFGPAPTSLIQSLQLSARRFRPSDTRPAVLAFRVGRVVSAVEGLQVLPVARLDVGLRAADGRSLGLLARLRDLLPGRYAFGLTGRDPDGNLLLPGAYTLRLLAVPTAGGPPTRRTVRFSIR
ncbi:MAG: S8 family serine peptidase, partial [Gaiellaceae bacterium]